MITELYASKELIVPHWKKYKTKLCYIYKREYYTPITHTERQTEKKLRDPVHFWGEKYKTYL